MCDHYCWDCWLLTLFVAIGNCLFIMLSTMLYKVATVDVDATVLVTVFIFGCSRCCSNNLFVPYYPILCYWLLLLLWILVLTILLLKMIFNCSCYHYRYICCWCVCNTATNFDNANEWYWYCSYLVFSSPLFFQGENAMTPTNILMIGIHLFHLSTEFGGIAKRYGFVCI